MGSAMYSSVLYRFRAAPSICRRRCPGLHQHRSTGTQIAQMEQIHADLYLDLRQSAADLPQSAFYCSTLMWLDVLSMIASAVTMLRTVDSRRKPHDAIPIARLPSPMVLEPGFVGGAGDGAHRDRLAGARGRRRSIRGRADLRGAHAAVAAVRVSSWHARRPRRPFAPTAGGRGRGVAADGGLRLAD